MPDSSPSLQSRDILAFSYSDWNATWSTPQQLMTRLAPHNRVLLVDQPRSFLFGVKGADSLGSGNWQGPALQEVRPNLFVYHPPHLFLPVGKLPFALAKQNMLVNGFLMARLVRAQMKKLGMRRPILWNFSPLHAPAIRHIAHQVLVQDICDEWCNYIPDEGGRRAVAWAENDITQKADVVFVGTDNARQMRQHLREDIQVVHHAADYAHFSSASLPETTVAEDIAALPHPIIGSVGVMDAQRFDVELVEALALARPQWSFALVGPVREGLNLDRLKQLSNVYLLGNRPIADLPRYLKGMDVTVIPYCDNEATRNIYPLKLQEYLATGKPVVSRGLPAIRPYGDVVALADSPDAFLAAIEAALVEDPARADARQAVARQNSWEQRVEQKSRLIMQAAQREGRNTV
jgi:glycosyltransferase involved in cell wall biosynthesis